jgi:hypothetical protein
MPRHWLQRSATQVQYTPSDLTHLRPVLVTFSSLIPSIPPPRVLFPSVFRPKFCMIFLSLPHVLQARPSRLLSLEHYNNIYVFREKHKLWSTSLANVLALKLLNLRFKYSSQQPTPAPAPLSRRSSTGVTASSTAIQTRGKKLQLWHFGFRQQTFRNTQNLQTFPSAFF